MAKEKQTGRTRREYKRVARKDAQARHDNPRCRKLLMGLPELYPLRLKRDSLGLALLFICAIVLYAASTPRTVMLEDDGLFITNATFAGVAHPPGYPLFIILGWLASLVPFGSVAWRVHALSGLMGALTCACVAYLVLRRTGNRPLRIWPARCSQCPSISGPGDHRRRPTPPTPWWCS